MAAALMSPNASANAPGIPACRAQGRFACRAQDEYFEVRFESIGGLGAHAAGQVLATASVVRMGLNGAHFSSYGSEKKGSLIRSYVRLGAGDRPIRTSAPIDRPDVIVVFHAALLRSPVTFAGLKANGILIYNAPAGVVPDAARRAARDRPRHPRGRDRHRDEARVASQRGVPGHAVRRVPVPGRGQRAGRAVGGIRGQAPGGRRSQRARVPRGRDRVRAAGGRRHRAGRPEPDAGRGALGL